jgi:hypothetical protein
MGLKQGERRMYGILAWMRQDFAQAMEKHRGQDLPQGTQEQLGKPREANLEEEHARFLTLVLQLIDAKKIDTVRPETFVKEEIYRTLSEDLQGKVDLAVPNIISLLERIMDLHARPEKDASLEMRSLIESLWLAKERIEQQADVFIF